MRFKFEFRYFYSLTSSFANKTEFEILLKTLDFARSLIYNNLLDCKNKMLKLCALIVVVLVATHTDLAESEKSWVFFVIV